MIIHATSACVSFHQNFLNENKGYININEIKRIELDF